MSKHPAGDYPWPTLRDWTGPMPKPEAGEAVAFEMISPATYQRFLEQGDRLRRMERIARKYVRRFRSGDEALIYWKEVEDALSDILSA